VGLGGDTSNRGFRRRAYGVGILALFLVVALVVAVMATPSATATSSRATAAAGSSATNLLSTSDATFDSSIGTWVNFSNANLQWGPGLGEGGSGALAATASGSPMAALSGLPSNGGVVAATPGSIYSGSLAAQVPLLLGGQQVETVLVFFDGSGNVINGVFGPMSSVGSTGWAQLAPVVALSPAGTAGVVLGFIDYGATTGTIVDFDNAWVEKAAAASPSVVGPLRTSANQILDANGTPITLRGVVLNGLEQDASSSEVTQQAVIEAKAWGANFVRLPLGEQFWMSSNCDYSPSYQATVSQVVNWITSLGMVALLDLHYNTVQGCESGGAHNMADAAQAPTFWSQVASQYASNPLVAFDLYNEPHDISDATWLNGGLTTDIFPPFETYQAAGMQQLYDAVRSTGAKNLVFVTGNNWGSTVPANLVNGTNIVYAAHAYTCPNSAPPLCANLDPQDPSQILDNWVNVSSSVPVMVTEFGWPSQYDGTYNANVIAFAESHGWGWTAFAFEDTQNSTIWDLTSGWFNNQTAEPSPSGMPVLCGLVAPLSGFSLCTPPASGSTSNTSNTPSTTSTTSTTSSKTNVRKSSTQRPLWMRALNGSSKHP
jgi:hypothetical protein